MAAQENELGGLHKLLTQAMSAGLQRELDEMVENEYHSPSPALMSVVAKFLKDNDISCSPDELREELGIESMLRDKRKREENANKLNSITLNTLN